MFFFSALMKEREVIMQKHFPLPCYNHTAFKIPTYQSSSELRPRATIVYPFLKSIYFTIVFTRCNVSTVRI